MGKKKQLEGYGKRKKRIISLKKGKLRIAEW